MFIFLLEGVLIIVVILGNLNVVVENLNLIV